MKKIYIRNASGWTMLIFGGLAIALGVIGILYPSQLLGLMNFEIVERAARAKHDFTLSFVTISSMASFNVGIYYVFAAFTNWKPFFLWTVPFRCLTFIVFTTLVILKYAPTGFLSVGLWELTGAIATGAALYIEKRKGIE
jgi:hypothetical protein